MNEASRRRDHQAELDAERAVNEQYRREMERKLSQQPHLYRQIAVVQNQPWTETAPLRPGINRGAIGAIIGRVALSDGHLYNDEIGQTFYIAGWRVEKDEYETVNWAAPIARVFFEGRSSEHELASSITARRTFVLQLTDLFDYSDEIEAGVKDPFSRRERALKISAAPTRRRPAVQPTSPSAAAAGRDSPSAIGQPASFVAETASEASDRTEHPHATVAQIDESRTVELPEPIEAEATTEIETRQKRLRAADAVVKVMQMPKQGRMGAVLPTMQPDQYHLVAASANRGLVVQGQPGTGKTVIAAHRAVYLTSEARRSDRIARVAIIGPSDQYVEHVAPVVSELKEPEAEISVLSLPALLRKIAGLRAGPKPGPIGRIESSWDVGRMVDRFVKSMGDAPNPSAPGGIDQRTRRVKRRGNNLVRVDPRPGRKERSNRDQPIRRVVEAMKRADKSEILDEEIWAWLQTLPRWNDISEQVRFLPMLATVALSLDPSAIGHRVGHLIVDEAQDIRPLEWRILTSSLLVPGGSLSLFGDMNQRRSGWTASSWQELAVDLDMTDDTGHCDVHELQMGYRSTRQILQFANQLLPHGKRGEQALRDGPQPTVTRVSAAGRTAAAVDAAIDLTKRHHGMVAVISAEPIPLSVALRERKWKKGRTPRSWRRDAATVVILHPDEARGLEFDAAVVVEPGALRRNVGMHGVLYTSLTRANKELVVVHSRALPRSLRPPS